MTEVDPNRITCIDALVRAESLFEGLFVVSTSVLDTEASIRRVKSVEIMGDDAVISFSDGGETTTSIGNTFVAIGTQVRIK